jgi:hypothetical protein
MHAPQCNAWARDGIGSYNQTSGGNLREHHAGAADIPRAMQLVLRQKSLSNFLNNILRAQQNQQLGFQRAIRVMLSYIRITRVKQVEHQFQMSSNSLYFHSMTYSYKLLLHFCEKLCG